MAPPPPPQNDMNLMAAVELLAPYISDLKHPRLSILRIEICVALAFAMLFLQLILGPWRRRSDHWFIQGTLWVAYTFSFPLITYTLGQMVSAPLKNVMFPLWAILMFWVAGCANSVTVYDLDDNKQWKRHLVDLLQYFVYSLLIVLLLTPTDLGNASNSVAMSATLALLFGSTFLSNCIRVFGCFISTQSLSSKVIADYTRSQVLPGNSNGYFFAFRGSEQLFSPRKGSAYIVCLNNDAVLTIDQVVELGANRPADDDDDSDDVCISFSLSELLKCRFFGMDCDEGTSSQALLKGVLLSKQYTRAFHIIEVELGFLYDFFFTKYAVLRGLELHNLRLLSVKLTLMFICGALLLIGSFTLSTSGYLITVVKGRVDVTVTLVIMGAIIVVEAVQGMLYLSSDWATASLASSEALGGGGNIIPSLIRCLRRFSRCKCWKRFGYWQNKLGQSSVIEGCLHVNRNSVFGGPRNYAIDLILSVFFSRKKLKEVPEVAKIEIVSCLHKHIIAEKKHTREETDAQEFAGTLRKDTEEQDPPVRPNFREEFAGSVKKGTQEQESETRFILMWHVATEFCSIEPCGDGDGNEEKYKEAATALSRYCAYLMSFVPDFLPGSSVDTVFINHRVLLEAREVISGEREAWRQVKSRKKILLDAVETYRETLADEEAGIMDDNEKEQSIFIRGLEKGRDLEQSIQNGRSSWKVLTEFWVETIIYIAPSDKVKEHMERLAQGGEFLTHVWALLTHAGILKREQLLPPQHTPVEAPHDR